MDELTRKQKVILYCLAVADSLVKKGFLMASHEGPIVAQKGMDVIAKLKEEGFYPTDEEIRWFVQNQFRPTPFPGEEDEHNG